MTTVPTPRTFGIWLPADIPIEVDGIRITNLSDDHRVLVEHGELQVPRSFTARIDRPQLPLVELEIELIDGRLRCTRLQMLPRQTSDHIAPSDLRLPRLKELIREATALVTYLVLPIVDNEGLEFVRTHFEVAADVQANPVDLSTIRVGDNFRFPAVLAMVTGGRKEYERVILPWVTELRDVADQPRRPGVPTDEDVVSAYRQALSENKQVIEEIANTFNWARPTAKNRIHRARKRGLLPPTSPGKASG